MSVNHVAAYEEYEDFLHNDERAAIVTNNAEVALGF